jgi:hypothetical protein
LSNYVDVVDVVIVRGVLYVDDRMCGDMHSMSAVMICGFGYIGYISIV